MASHSPTNQYISLMSRKLAISTVIIFSPKETLTIQENTANYLNSIIQLNDSGYFFLDNFFHIILIFFIFTANNLQSIFTNQMTCFIRYHILFSNIYFFPLLSFYRIFSINLSIGSISSYFPDQLIFLIYSPISRLHLRRPRKIVRC